MNTPAAGIARIIYYAIDDNLTADQIKDLFPSIASTLSDPDLFKITREYVVKRITTERGTRAGKIAADIVNTLPENPHLTCRRAQGVMDCSECTNWETCQKPFKKSF